MAHTKDQWIINLLSCYSDNYDHLRQIDKHNHVDFLFDCMAKKEYLFTNKMLNEYLFVSIPVMIE